MRRLLAAAALAGLVAAAGAAAQQSSPRSAATTDKRGDGPGKLDLVRASLTAEDELRASFTMAEEWGAADLLADAAGGPPGSVCLLLWEDRARADTPPDHLVCLTATGKEDELRATVLRERTNAPPRKVADAQVARATGRTVIVRFPARTVGSPKVLRFAGEAVAPGGCADTRCVDSAPNAPRTAALRLGSD